MHRSRRRLCNGEHRAEGRDRAPAQPRTESGSRALTDIYSSCEVGLPVLIGTRPAILRPVDSILIGSPTRKPSGEVRSAQPFLYGTLSPRPFLRAFSKEAM